MIKHLKEELKKAIESRDKVVAPYNKRVKALRNAIANLEQYNGAAEEISKRKPETATKAIELNEKA